MTGEPDFKPALLGALRSAIPEIGEIAELVRLSGGASQESWAFDAMTPSGAVPLILRRAPGGKRPLERANAIPLATEAEAIEAARHAGVAAPRIRYVLKPGDGAGEGYVMDRIAGETIARRILRDAAFDTVRPKLARQCGEILARIHATPTGSLAQKLPHFDGPAQLRLYRDIYDSYDYPHPVFEMAFKWLEPRIASPRPKTLVHGDFRNGNLLISQKGVEAVLDWELCHIGDPMEDLGWICTNSWRFGVADKVVGGFGDLDELLAGYEAAGGTRADPEEVRAWIAYGSLKWGIMCMSMYHAYATGMDRSVERAAIGRRASETEIDLINLIIRGGF